MSEIKVEDYEDFARRLLGDIAAKMRESGALRAVAAAPGPRAHAQRRGIDPAAARSRLDAEKIIAAFGDWLVDQQLDQPDCAAVDDLIEVKAVSLYRVLYLMERGGKREAAAAAASLRHWVGLA